MANTALSPDNTSDAMGLMNRHGVAGQWVLEVCGIESTPVSDGAHSGERYEYRQVVCGRGTRTEITNASLTLSMTVPLNRTPVPAIAELLDGLERARTLAIETASVDFAVMSVSMTRTPPVTTWFFRFYDNDDIIARGTVSIDGNTCMNFCRQPWLDSAYMKSGEMFIRRIVTGIGYGRRCPGPLRVPDRPPAGTGHGPSKHPSLA